MSVFLTDSEVKAINEMITHLDKDFEMFKEKSIQRYHSLK